MNSRNFLLLAGALTLIFLVSNDARAQLLSAPFDGSAAPGEFYEKDSCKVVENPINGYRCVRYVEGHSGQAVQFGQYSAMATPLDIDPQSYPQLTITAWVKRDNTGAGGYIVATGNNKGIPYLFLRNGQLTAMAGDEWRVNVDGIEPLPVEEWTFVAGVWDHDIGKLKLRSGSSKGQADFLPSENVIEQKLWPARDGSLRRYIFIGAQDFIGFGGPTKTVEIDDVRIYGRALTDGEIDTLAAGGTVPGGEQLADTQPESVDTSLATAGAPCSAPGECGAGEYCAWDQTCHPERHAPMKSFELVSGVSTDGLVLPVDPVPPKTEDEQITGDTFYADATTADNEPTTDSNLINATQTDVDYDAIQSDLEQRRLAGEERREREAGQAELDAQQNELEAQWRLEAAEAEAAAQAEAESTASSGKTTTQSSGGVQAGSGLRTVQQHLEAWNLENITPTGDVRDCRSYAEVTGEVAANTRDDIMVMAGGLACQFLGYSIWTTAAGAAVTAAVVYDSDNFKEVLLFEALEKCLAGTTELSMLPDKAVTFWNQQIANDNWATVGPRSIRRKIPEYGNLVSPGDRKFLTVSPLLNQNTVSLALKELDGKARVTARVCKISIDNEYTLLRTFSMNETPGERENESQLEIWDLNDVKGHHIAVILDASGLLGRNFKYEINIE